MKRKTVIAQAALVVGLMVFAASASAGLTYFDAQVFSYNTGKVTIPPNTTYCDLGADCADVPFTPYPYGPDGFDQNDGNGALTQADGNWANGGGGSQLGEDGYWRRRSNNQFGNPNPAGIGDILDARGSAGGDPRNTEVLPVTKTTVNVDPGDIGQERGVYVLFWSDGAAWRIGACLECTSQDDMIVYRGGWDRRAYNYRGSTPGMGTGNLAGPGLSGYVFEVFDARQTVIPKVPGPQTPGLAAGYPISDAGPFLVMNGNANYTSTDAGWSNEPTEPPTGTGRHLWAAWLGNVTLEEQLSVYVGHGPALTYTEQQDSGNHRTWYDGIAYGDPQELTQLLCIPEPASLVLVGIGLAGLLVRRRAR